MDQLKAKEVIAGCIRTKPHVCSVNGPCNSCPKTRWLQTEREQVELGLVFVTECYWKDQAGKFWFNDETQADVCGPFDTLEECQSACNEYAQTL